MMAFVLDLLSKDPKNKLELKENIESGVYVKDLTSFVVKNAPGACSSSSSSSLLLCLTTLT
jgi:hypothetical protein